MTATNAPASADNPGTDDYRLLHAASYMAFFCVGVYAATFGPVLPFIADDLGVSLDTAGLLLTVFFVGSISASGLIALVLHGADTRLLTAAGLLCILGGVTMIALATTWPLALAGGALLGLGDGLVVAALHILIAVTSRDVPAAINRLNLYFGFGAFAGPVWAGAILATAEDREIVYAGVGAVALVALAMLFLAAAPARTTIASPDEGFRLPGHATAWIMGVVLFLYVGAEFGLGSWFSTYVRETADAGVFTGALLTSGYWAALAGGRMVSGAYFARGRDPSLLLALSIAGAGAASIVLALTGGYIVASAAAAFAVGLCLGPIWPATVAIASEGAIASATAATVTMGNAGGIAIPWMQGKVLVGAGPDEGVLVTAVLCAVMLTVVLMFRASRARSA
ncbi:MAG: MFS transporter [Dehalococcoidia bacterium]